MTIKVFKMVTGEEIVLNVTSEDNDTYTGNKARSVIVRQIAAQQYGLDLIPFLRAEPDAILTIPYHAVAAMTDASASLEKAYYSSVSEIEIASSLSPLLE